MPDCRDGAGISCSLLFSDDGVKLRFIDPRILDAEVRVVCGRDGEETWRVEGVWGTSEGFFIVYATSLGVETARRWRRWLDSMSSRARR